MNKVKEFMEFLFAKEQEAIDAGNKKAEFEKYNVLAAEIKSYMNDITVGFGLPVLTSPKPAILYKENPVYPGLRHLFKISEYEHESYGTVWACYVSGPNASATVKRMSDCFLIAEVEGSLKVIAKMGIDPNDGKWTFYGGDEDKSLRLHNMGKPVKIERYLEPVSNDAWSLEQYNKEI